MDLSKLFIGIDTGGTNCRIALGDNRGRILHSGNYESVHYSQVGRDAFTKHISGIILEFCDGINLSLESITGICIGAAGARNDTDKEGIKEDLSEKLTYHNIAVESDTAIAYEDAFGEGDGLLLICGTGSVLFGRLKGKNIRMGGWGKLLGDTGSSYSISLNVLKELTKHIDETEEACLLEEKLETGFGINRNNILTEIYHKNFNIHSLAPLIIELAGKGDGMCREAVNREAEGLVHLLNSFVKKHAGEKEIPVAFSGSVIENDNYFSNKLIQYIKDKFGNTFIITEERVNTLKGAIKTAINKFSK
jgi:N-acetylglucosamine kinase-like BadF-type ATPase